ncbi:hypothetical protein YC2023_052022 [Brassica napus]
MLGAKASKAKNIPSDEAVNLTACKGVSDLESPQEADTPHVSINTSISIFDKLLSSKVRENNLDALGQSQNNCGERKTCCPNCIGVVFMLARPTNKRCFGIIRQFDEVSKKHLVTYEDGVTKAIDMSREVWKLIIV